jgi:hypothetical protein
MKKPITAMSDGNCRLDNPLMAWPDVQPPAHREPKPTRNPPTMITKKPLKVRMLHQLNNSSGAIVPSNGIPKAPRSCIVDSLKASASGLPRNLVAIKPPAIAPSTKTSFHF